MQGTNSLQLKKGNRKLKVERKEFQRGIKPGSSGWKALKYLYLLKLFEGFTATDYSRFYAYATSINAVGLLVILPVLSKLFHLHDSLLLTICVGTEAGGNNYYNCKNVKIFWQLLIVIPDVLDNVN